MKDKHGHKKTIFVVFAILIAPVDADVAGVRLRLRVLPACTRGLRASVSGAFQFPALIESACR
jgi:hypothetical protein